MVEVRDEILCEWYTCTVAHDDPLDRHGGVGTYKVNLTKRWNGAFFGYTVDDVTDFKMDNEHLTYQWITAAVTQLLLSHPHFMGCLDCTCPEIPATYANETATIVLLRRS